MLYALVDALRANRKIEAIKEVRSVTSCGLKEAKDVVEAFFDARTAAPEGAQAGGGLMTTKIVVAIEFTVMDENECPITDLGTLIRLAEDTAYDVRNRLFGEGFLPSDLLVGEYKVTPGIKEG